MGTTNEGGRGDRSLPRAMRHKQILDVAAEQPDASIESIAEDVPSATADLVEHVLEEYGDPATSESNEQDVPDAADSEGAAGANGDSGEPTFEKFSPADGDENRSDATDGDDGDGDGAADTEDEAADADDGADAADENDAEEGEADVRPSDLTAKQREVLRVIRDRPQATQREIGDELGISAAAVSNRVNEIEGFDWTDRQAIAEAVVTTPPSESPEGPADMATDESEPTDSIDQLRGRIATIERRLDDLAAAEDARSGLDDPELLHKVLRACFESDSLTEDEERRVLKELLR